MAPEKVCFVLLVLFLFSCTKSEIVKYPDPLAQSFKGKNIHYCIAMYVTDSSLIDTVFFDKRGYIIRHRGLMSDTKFLYDSSFYLVHALSSTDGLGNYYFNYVKDENGNLIRMGHEVQHLNWEISEKDEMSLDSAISETYIIEDGRIVRVNNLSGKAKSKFIYDGFDRLVLHQEIGFDSFSEWKYVYLDDKDILKEISYSLDGRLRSTDYFSAQGLRDSTIYSAGPKDPVKYYYYYY